LIVAEAAKADLKNIWRFSAQRWGPDQADAYVTAIDAMMHEAAAGKLHSREMPFVSPGLFKARAMKHFLYFREVAGGIRIVRVLHERMDETLHLL
jgi:toxin ParE1/3/4